VPNIHTENLRKEFKEVVAVRDVTITFPTSTVTCLLGPSGCGKTTLLRMIAGLEKPTSGEIYFDDVQATALEPEKRNIGMVFQYPVVYRGLNVYRNIDLPLAQDKLSERERKKRIEEVVEVLDLRNSLEKNIDELDNSTRQKVAVARAIARKPQIILFDEPLTNVDVNTKVQLKEALKNLTRQLKQTIVYVTHDQTEAMTLADQIALMNQGEIVQQDTPRTLYNHPSDVFGGWFLGNPGMNFIEVRTENGEKPAKVKCAVFPKDVRLKDTHGEKTITLGVRPENVRILKEKSDTAVRAQVIRKSIQVGGQYLLLLKTGDVVLKSKVRPEVGYGVGEEVWIEVLASQVIVFGKNGQRIETTLEI
jgi:ABC-type sugar transport system ATPase subunit